MDNKTSKNILLAIMGVLIVIEIVARIATIQISTIPAVAHLISLVFVAIYGFGLYKKPHGNMLKYAMLIFALATIIGSSVKLLTGGSNYHIARILASAAVCYCAGRLDRIDRNKYLLPIIGIVFFATSVFSAVKSYYYTTDNFLLIIASFNFTINFITIMIAYFVRYKEHKEAGIKDAPIE